MSSKKIAVVGSGCSAIGALWALRDSGCTTHLYECNSRLGGHTNTVPFYKNGAEVMVDAGFIAYNRETYPNFVRFLDYLEVRSTECEMSLAFSRDSGGFEWAGTSIFGLFSQMSNIFRMSFWRMLFDVIRFNYLCLDELRSGGPLTHAYRAMQDSGKSIDGYESIGSYLRRQQYSQTFINSYLIPMLAATWCTRPDIFQLECPARDVIRFMWNHHLLESLNNPLRWYTIRGGSKTYIDRFMALFPPTKIFLNSQVSHLERLPDGTVSLQNLTRPAQTYDHVILAVPASEALRILGNSASVLERHVLGSFHTCINTVTLHSDLSLMPRRRSAWSGWNYLAYTPNSLSPSRKLYPSTPTVTFDMNTLQNLCRSTYGPVLCSMNPPWQPDPSTVQGSWRYEHPVYSAAAIRAHRALPKIQNVSGVSFAGAWTDQGFHEDGFTSGIRAAVEFLSVNGPDPGPERGFIHRYNRSPPPLPTWWDWIMRGLMQRAQKCIIALEEGIWEAKRVW